MTSTNLFGWLHQTKLMTYQDFQTIFKQQVDTLPYESLLDLALAVCKRLYFDYENFVMVEHWGDKDVLMDAIRLCDQAKTELNADSIKKMLIQVVAVTPDTEDFGDLSGSYALNAAASVYDTLQFILDKEPVHIIAIGTYLTDTVDFKIQEREHLTEEQIDEHPMMVEARDFMLKSIAQRRST